MRSPPAIEGKRITKVKTETKSLRKLILIYGAKVSFIGWIGIKDPVTNVIPNKGINSKAISIISLHQATAQHYPILGPLFGGTSCNSIIW